MAEDSGQEKTEEATQKKRDEAKKQGQVPRSKELSTTLVTIAGAVMMLFFSGGFGRGAMNLFSQAFSEDYLTIKDPQLLPVIFFDMFYQALLLTIPLFAVLFVAATIASVAMGGWTFSLTFKPERIDPVAGLGRLFTLKSLVELGKAIGKVLVVGFAAVLGVTMMQDQILGLINESVDRSIPDAIGIIMFFFLIASLPLILIAGIDVPFQLWNHAKELRMTKQEVRDEMKETDGRPEVKSKLREMQQAAARRRMMADVPKADVVITNPTHYSVALQYREVTGGAPVVLAKGVDLMAARIRETAQDADVPVIESPRLARAVYATTDIGHEIPQDLYLAVAQILAYVYQLRDWQVMGGEFPEQPEPEVDDELLKGLRPDPA